LYATNFAINNKDYEVAPYIALSEIYDINLKDLKLVTKDRLLKKKDKFRGGKHGQLKLKEYLKLELDTKFKEH
jgi:hypothetical protein